MGEGKRGEADLKASVRWSATLGAGNPFGSRKAEPQGHLRTLRILGLSLAGLVVSRCARLLEAKDGMQRMLVEIPLTENERAAVEGDQTAVDRLVAVVGMWG